MHSRRAGVIESKQAGRLVAARRCCPRAPRQRSGAVRALVRAAAHQQSPDDLSSAAPRGPGRRANELDRALPPFVSGLGRVFWGPARVHAPAAVVRVALILLVAASPTVAI